MKLPKDQKILLLSLIGAILGFFVCVFILYNDHFNNVDRALESIFTPYWSSEATRIALLLTDIASTKVTALIIFLLALFLWFKKKREDVVLVLLAGILGLGSVFILKDIFGIDRPPLTYFLEEGFRFPSGHAATSMFISLSFLYVLRNKIQNKMHILLALILVLGFSFIVGATRVYFNVHRVVDLFAGYFAVLGGYSLSLIILNKVESKIFSKIP